MRKLATLCAAALFTGACSTTKPVTDASLELDVEVLKHKVETLQQDSNDKNYMIANDVCLIEYTMCRVDNKASPDKCWKVQEDCVISVHHIFKGK